MSRTFVLHNISPGGSSSNCLKRALKVKYFHPLLEYIYNFTRYSSFESQLPSVIFPQVDLKTFMIRKISSSSMQVTGRGTKTCKSLRIH